MIKIRKPNLQLIYVSVITTSTEYYKKLFNIEPFFVTPRYVAFKIDGDADFAIWSGGDVPDKNAPRYSEIGINLNSDDEVVAFYNELKGTDDIHIEKELYTEVFGKTFLVKDPDGHIIRVSSKD